MVMWYLMLLLELCMLIPVDFKPGRSRSIASDVTSVFDFVVAISVVAAAV